MKHDVVSLLAGLGLVGQVLVVVLVLSLLVARDAIRRLFWGRELWAAFVVSAIGTGGSLYFSQVVGFIPCELCWFQRICLYPLSLLTLFAAVHGDHKVSRYLIPFPVIGAGVSVYHLLIENNVIKEPQACQINSAVGCGTKWINYFGYMTIPTLAITAFALLTIFLGLSAAGAGEDAGRLPADA